VILFDSTFYDFKLLIHFNFMNNKIQETKKKRTSGPDLFTLCCLRLTFIFLTLTTFILMDVTLVFFRTSPMTVLMSLGSLFLHLMSVICFVWYFLEIEIEPTLVCINKLSVNLLYMPMCMLALLMCRFICSLFINYLKFTKSNNKLIGKDVMDDFLCRHKLIFIILLIGTGWALILICIFIWGEWMTIHA